MKIKVELLRWKVFRKKFREYTEKLFWRIHFWFGWVGTTWPSTAESWRCWLPVCFLVSSIPEIKVSKHVQHCIDTNKTGSFSSNWIRRNETWPIFLTPRLDQKPPRARKRGRGGRCHLRRKPENVISLYHYTEMCYSAFVQVLEIRTPCTLHSDKCTGPQKIVLFKFQCAFRLVGKEINVVRIIIS